MVSAQPHSEASMIHAGGSTARQAVDAPVHPAAVGAGVALTICVLGVVQPAWKVLFLILVLLVIFVVPVPSGDCAGVHLRNRAQVDIAAARLPDPPRNLVRWDTVAEKITSVHTPACPIPQQHARQTGKPALTRRYNCAGRKQERRLPAADSWRVHLGLRAGQAGLVLHASLALPHPC